MRAHRARRLIAVPALAAALAAPGAALAGGVEPVPLPTPQLSIGVGPLATLAPNRVVARVPVNVMCAIPGAPTAYVSVTLTQANGRRVASGYGSVPGGAPCDGVAHDVVVAVTASSGGAPFRLGDAAASASVSACGPEEGTCGFAETEPQDVVLVRK